jgi:hypothetical protein
VLASQKLADQTMSTTVVMSWDILDRMERAVAKVRDDS